MRSGLMLLALVGSVIVLAADQGPRVRVKGGKIRGATGGGGGGGEFAFVTGGHNGPFTDLCADSSAVACYGLRDDTEINLYDSGGGVGEADVAYDATEDAAQWTWLTDEKNGERLYLPLNEAAASTGYPFPVAGSDKLLIISDVRLDDTWDTECNMSPAGRTCGWKLMQLARGDNSSIGNTMFEYQDYIAQNSVPNLGPLSPNGWHAPYFRTYPTVTSSMGGFICSADTSDRVALSADDNPTLNGDTDCFISPHSTWMRYFTEVTRTAGNNYIDITVWMADENTDPITLVEGVRIVNTEGLFYYWMEWDTSSETRTGGTMKAWMRNFVVLKDPSLATTNYLTKPLATNKWTYQQGFNSYNTAVLHGQDGWSAPNVSGETMFTVQGNTVSEGAKAIEMELGTHPRIQKTLPAAIETGDLTFRIRKSTATYSEQVFNLIDTGNSKRVYIRLGEYENVTDNNISGYDNGVWVAGKTGALANTWYHVNVQFSSATDQFRFRVKADGGSYGNWTSWLAYSGATGSNIEKIEFTGEGDEASASHRGFFDLIKPWSGS